MYGVNGNHFFQSKNQGKEPTPIDINCFRNRIKKPNIRYCPNDFYTKLELKHYAFNTAKTYITFFERFLNDHPTKKTIEIDELNIKNYMNKTSSNGVNPKATLT